MTPIKRKDSPPKQNTHEEHRKAMNSLRKQDIREEPSYSMNSLRKQDIREGHESSIDAFNSFSIAFGGTEHKKTLSIPIITTNNYNDDCNIGSNYTNSSKNFSVNAIGNNYSKSWGCSGPTQTDMYYKPNSTVSDKRYSSSPTYENLYSKKRYNNAPSDNFVPYNAIANCKSAGIIPYTIHNDQLYFLLQKEVSPISKKNSGWNDFGGKKLYLNENTADTAAREFSEETNCLFYLNEHKSVKNDAYYNLFKDNNELKYDDHTIAKIKKIIPKSQEYFSANITKYIAPIYISTKETYISYFVKVSYIPEEDLPRAEDIHIPYEQRYIRNCKWLSTNEILALDEKDFHKRLQITRIQERIKKNIDKGVFV